MRISDWSSDVCSSDLRGGFDSIENAKGYVYRVAENVFADHMRRAAVRRSHAHDQFDESLHAGVDFSPEHVLAKKERLARAMEILQALPDRTRIIFVLRRIEGWKYQEIAERYGISVRDRKSTRLNSSH